MARDRKIDNANLDWSTEAPRSIVFDDIYFSGDGPAETTHVFLNGNGLPAQFEKSHRFVIGELGFGTGLNFLVAWKLWRKTAPQNARLTFFSVEAFPLALDDMAKAHALWPALAGLSAKLRNAYPPAHPGLHRIELDGGVSLMIFFGEALDGLREMDSGGVDAWFLDGFSPAKNPDMWRPELMMEVARLSNQHATLATFTVAGTVRRALDAAGFKLEKRPGYGAKREMLSASLSASFP